VLRRTGAFFGGLCRLQIGTEMARTFDDPFVLRQTLRFETAERGVDVLGRKRFHECRRIICRFGNPGGNVRPCYKSSVADNRHAPKGKLHSPGRKSAEGSARR